MTLTIAHRTYLLASTLAGPLAGPILNKRLKRGKEDADRMAERLGTASLPRPDGRLIWMHGASVGEAMSMLPLIHALLEAEDDIRILVTTGTVTSAQRLANVLPDRAFHQYLPVDTRNAVRGFLDHWYPDLAIWVESELWPRLVTDTAVRGIPMALVNARFSEKSMRGWRRVQGMLRSLLGCFRLIRTQDRATLDRLKPYAGHAEFGGNLKACIDTPDCDEAELAKIREALDNRPVWLAASTHPADEPGILAAQSMLSDTSDQRPLLLLAPRHPERRIDIADALRTVGLTVAIRSNGEAPMPETDVWLTDTMGEMGLWYRLAPVTFVGGSFGTEGGHTPFEPILLDSVILHGPNVANFQQIYEALSEAGGGHPVKDDPTKLAEVVAELLADPSKREAFHRNARSVHKALMPDLDGLVRDVLTLIEPRS